MSEMSRPTLLPAHIPLPSRATTVTTRPTAIVTDPTNNQRHFTNVNLYQLIAASVGSVAVIGALIYYLRSRSKSATVRKSAKFVNRKRGGGARVVDVDDKLYTVCESPAAQMSAAPPSIAPDSAGSSTGRPESVTGTVTLPGTRSSIAALSSSPQLQSNSQTLTDSTSSLSSSTSQLSDPRATATVDEAELIELLNQQMISLQTDIFEPSLEQHIRTILALSNTDADSAAIRALAVGTRIMVVQWLLSIDTYTIQHTETEANFDDAMNKQYQDMLAAWGILASITPTPAAIPDGVSDDELRVIDLQKIQVGQNLKDGALIAPVFDRVYKRANALSPLNDDELLLLFTTAPMLGKWREMRSLGSLVENTISPLQEFHFAPIDYETLFHLTRTSDGADRPNDSIDSLQWCQYRILSQRIKLIEVQCEDATAVEQLKQEFSNSGSDIDDSQWKDVNVNEAPPIVRLGGFIQIASFSSVPMTLVGPCSSARIECAGYADLQSDCIVRQSETYSLTCVDPEPLTPAATTTTTTTAHTDSHSQRARMVVAPRVRRDWRGQYTMTQEKIDEQDQLTQFAKIHVIFDLELTVESMEQ